MTKKIVGSGNLDLKMSGMWEVEPQNEWDLGSWYPPIHPPLGPATEPRPWPQRTFVATSRALGRGSAATNWVVETVCLWKPCTCCCGAASHQTQSGVVRNPSRKFKNRRSAEQVSRAQIHFSAVRTFAGRPVYWACETVWCNSENS